MSYKDFLYRQYITTHLAHRKGTTDAAVLHRQGRVFERHFGRFLPKERTAAIADLGCGSGALVWWLKQRGYGHVRGVDTSAEQIALAHQLGIDSVVEGDVFDFLSQSAEYDVLFARDLVEHFDKQTVFDFLQRCRDGLRSSGTLILQVPNAESPYFGRVRYGDFTHELAFTRSSLTQLLGAAGFADVRVHPWPPGVVSLSSALRYTMWKLTEALLKLPAWLESGKAPIVTSNVIATARKP